MYRHPNSAQYLTPNPTTLTLQDYTRTKGVAPAQRHNKPELPPTDGHGPDDSRKCVTVANRPANGLTTSLSPSLPLREPGILEAAYEQGTDAVLRVGTSVFAARITPELAAVTTGAEAATGE